MTDRGGGDGAGGFRDDGGVERGGARFFFEALCPAGAGGGVLEAGDSGGGGGCRGPVGRVLAENGLAGRVARLRMTLTAGEEGGEPNLWVRAFGIEEPPEVVEVTGSGLVRNAEGGLAGLKSVSWAESAAALEEARAAGAGGGADAQHAGGAVRGGRRAMCSLVRGGEVRTPPLSSGCLPGVMREVALEVCGELGIPVSEEALFPGDLEEAEEVFLTSAVRRVQGVGFLGEVGGAGCGRAVLGMV